MNPARPQILRRQVQVLVDQFLTGTGAAWIGVKDPAHFGKPGVPVAPMRLGGRMELLPGRLPALAFVWVQGSDPELWVDPRATNYRDLFDEFAKARLGLAGRPMGVDWNIDHVFPKAAGALDGLSHVRAMAIGAGGNQSLGRTVEKAMKQRADGKAARKEVRHATWMTIGKAAGYEGWDSLPDIAGSATNQAAARALFGWLATVGITAPAGKLEEKLTADRLASIH